MKRASKLNKNVILLATITGNPSRYVWIIYKNFKTMWICFREETDELKKRVVKNQRLRENHQGIKKETSIVPVDLKNLLVVKSHLKRVKEKVAKEKPKKKMSHF